MSKEIEQLIQGYHKFRLEYFETKRRSFEALAREGQKPKVMVIACSDSRVDPALILNCEPGDLFVVRNVANLVPPYEDDTLHYHGTSAALEFGVRILGVSDIIVFGHMQCGGIKALLEGKSQSTSFIEKWMETAKPAHDIIKAQHAQAPLEQQMMLCEQYSLMHSLNNLYDFPWIKERVVSHKLALHAWYFELTTGIIHRLDTEQRAFVPLETPIVCAETSHCEE